MLVQLLCMGMNDTISGIARHVLTTGGGALVTKGVVTATTLDQGIGALMTLVGIIWSIVSKKNSAAPADSTDSK
jgi:hypothetical protein